MNLSNQFKEKAIRGFIWTILESVGSRGVTLIIQIILARLLTPADFGIIGMIAIFIAVSQTLLDSGFQNALIREQNVGNKEYSTVFIFNLLMSIVLYGLLFISAPMISDFYNAPIVVNVLRVLGLILIINSFGLIQRTMLSKKFNFQRQTKITLISSAISGVLAISTAYMGAGVWSLVIQQLSNQFLQSLLYIVMNKWKPILIFDRKIFNRYFQFGWKLTASGIINTLYQNSFYVIIGRFYLPSELGYFTNAQKFNDVPVQTLTQSIQKVTYPLLSQLNNNTLELKRNYQKIISYVSLISFMMMLALSVTAIDLIPFVFGDSWINSVPFFQIMCLSGMLYPINAINLNILQVLGRSDLFLKLEIVKKIIGISFIFISLLFNFGILGLVWANVLASIFNTSLNIIVSARLINYSYWEQIKDLYKPFLSAIIMAVSMSLIREIQVEKNTVVILVSQYLSGVFIYYVLSKYVFKIKEIRDIEKFILLRLKKETFQ